MARAGALNPGARQAEGIGRRELLGLLGGAAAAWPGVAWGQQSERVRRVGILMNLTADHPEAQPRLKAFVHGMQELGWIDGRNATFEVRWGSGLAAHYRKYAEELVALAPNVILVASSPGLAAVQQATRTLPIVFVNVGDPVGSGFVASLPRPGGNATGFTQFEFGLSAKWLELLREIAPRVKRAGVLRDPTIPSAIGQLGALQAVAPLLRLDVVPMDVHADGEVERGISALANEPDSGLVVVPGGLTTVRGGLIVTLAAKHRLPAVYPYRYYVTSGGLIGYGPDLVNPFQRAAGYVDRILKGEKPADLPVQAPTKYELAINLKTAKALGLTVPNTLLATVDEVIE